MDEEQRGNNTVLATQAEMDIPSVKDEIVAQDGIPPLVQCATEEKFAKLKTQELAMKVLLKLAFHKDAVKALRKYPELVANLKAISENDEDTQGVPEEDMATLLWKLTLDQKKRCSARGRHEEYDIMLSYCHANKDVCNKVHRYLTSNYNYTIWIDHECLRNRVRDGMAKAVESSKIVIICLSDSYTDSSACRCEAEYAFQLNRGVIPLYVQPGFRIKQGWLLMMINGLRHLDYHKLGLGNIFKELKKEIDGYLDLDGSEENSPSPPPSKQKQGDIDNEQLVRERDDLYQILTERDQKIQELNNSLQEFLKEKNDMERHLSRATMQLENARKLIQSGWKLPRELQSWSQLDVQVFLDSAAFSVFLPYFERSSGGPYLLKTYHKCLENPDEMLQLLQKSVGGQDKLSEATFKMLLDRLEEYAPRPATPVKSGICTIM